MRVGIIAEGPCDQAVIRNILKGARGIQKEDVQLILPELFEDRTDRIAAPEGSYSNCELVRAECRKRDRIREFFNTGLDEERWLVIHLDTDLVEKLDIARPPRADSALHGDELEAKVAEYAAELRARVAAKMSEWLEGEFADHIRFAIAVEETESWLLAHWDTKTKGDPARHANPKKRLDHVLNNQAGLSDRQRKLFFPLDDPRCIHEVSEPLRKRKTLDAAAERSTSLKAFVGSLPTVAE